MNAITETRTPARKRKPPDLVSRDTKPEPANDPSVPITGFAAAVEQVAAIFGSADAVIRIRAIHPLKNREDRDKSIELQGTLAELRARLEELNAAGYNIYLIPQPHRPPSGTQVADADVTGINCLFTDNDKAIDAAPDHHVNPSFALVHPKTKYRWDYWLTDKETFPLADFTPMQRRLAKHYGSDPKVINPGRIVRLAGFDRWKKGENFGPYDFFAGTMDTTDHWQHQGLPALADVPHYKGTGEVIEWDNARAHANNERAPELDAVIVPWDLPENIALAIEWLNAEAKVAVLGSQGNNTAYATAAKMCSYGLSQQKAFEILLKHWAPKCEPAWTNEVDPRNEKKLRDIIAHAYYYNKKPPAGHTPAYRAVKLGFKPGEGAENEPAAANGEAAQPATAPAKRTKFRFANAEEQEQAPPVSYLIDNCLPNDAYCTLLGNKGTFKTFLALDMAFSVATGAGELWPGIDPGPVLFGFSEGGAGLLARRQTWQTRHYKGQRVPNFYTVNPVPHVDDLAGNAYREFIAGAKRYHPRYKLVIIDTVGRAMQGVNENLQEHASKFTRLVDALRNDLGCTVLAIQHSGYGEEKRARGSSVFGADADTILRVERPDPKAFQVELHMEKQKDGPEWEHPKKAMLEVVGGSLVVRAASPFTATGANPAEAVRTRVEGSANNPNRNNPAVLEMIDKELARILKGDRTNRWSTPELAEALEGCPAIDLSADTIRTKQLRLLKADKSTHAHRCYIRGRLTGGKKAKRWVWVESGTSFWDTSNEPTQ